MMVDFHVPCSIVMDRVWAILMVAFLSQHSFIGLCEGILNSFSNSFNQIISQIPWAIDLNSASVLCLEIILDFFTLLCHQISPYKGAISRGRPPIFFWPNPISIRESFNLLLYSLPKKQSLSWSHFQVPQYSIAYKCFSHGACIYWLTTLTMKEVWSYMTQMLDFLWRLYDKEYGKDLYTFEDILEDSPTLHRILWIQRVKGVPFI